MPILHPLWQPYRRWPDGRHMREESTTLSTNQSGSKATGPGWFTKILSERHAAFWTVIGGVVAVITLGVTLFPDHGNAQHSAVPLSSASTTAQSPTATPEITDSPAQPDTSSPSSSGDETTEPGDTPAAPEPVYLTDMPLTDYDHKNGFALWDSGIYSTNGKQYPHSISVNAGCQNDDSGDFWLEYDIARSFSTLSLTVGLNDDDSSGVKMSYTVSVDGKTLSSGTLTQGMSKPLKLAVSNGLRLRLALHDSKVYECGSGWKASMVWGEAKLTP